MVLTGAEIVIRCLQEEKVDYLFGYPGGAVLYIYDELFKQDKVRHVLVRHEQAAVHAADGYARSTMVLTGRQRYRVLFPLTWRGKLRMLIGRSIFPDVEPKYLNSIGEKFVYNLPDNDAKTIILSEGCVKAIAISAVSKVPSCASLGTSLTPLMLEQLEQAGVKTVVVWPDPDDAGILGAMKIAKSLEQVGINVKVLWPIPTKQADDYSVNELKQILKQNTVPYTRMLEVKYVLERKARSKK